MVLRETADEPVALVALEAGATTGATVVFGAVALAAAVTGTGATAGAEEAALLALLAAAEPAGAWIWPSPIWVTGARLTDEVEEAELALDDEAATAVTGATGAEETAELALDEEEERTEERTLRTEETEALEEETEAEEEAATTAVLVALVVVGAPVGAWI